MTTHHFAMNKLVRDKIVEIMRNEGADVEPQILDDAAFAKALRTKLDEELAELDSANTAEKVGEFADVLEVLYKMAELNDIAPADIEKARQKKNAGKGGFDARHFIGEFSVDSDEPKAAYYLSQPDKFRPVKK